MLLIIFIIRRNDTLKGDGNFTYTPVCRCTYKIRRNDTLKGDGNYLSSYSLIANVVDKKKRYSERRRKPTFIYIDIIPYKIRRNDTLKGDGNLLLLPFHIF